MQISPYLTFNGQCELAFKYYESCLGAKIETLFPWEGSPAAVHVPAEFRKKVMHARLVLAGQELNGADMPPDKYQKPQGFHVSLSLKDEAQAERIFAALAENGTVQMPLEKTFWAARFGMVVDQFGIPWMINCEA